MSTHRLVGAKQLAGLTRGAEQSNLEVKAVVTTLHKTRQREFHANSQVFNLEALDVVTKAPIHFYFYDEWASGASFVNVGDEVTLRGVIVLDVPRLARNEEELLSFHSPLRGECSWYVTHCSGNISSFTAAQPAEQGDVIEVTVQPPDFENPTAKVKKGVKGMGSGNSGVQLADGSGKVVQE